MLNLNLTHIYKIKIVLFNSNRDICKFNVCTYTNIYESFDI